MKTKIQDVMTTPAVVVEGDATFRQMTDMLRRYLISALPVVDGERRVIGIVSEADLIVKEEREELERAPRLLQTPRTAAARHKAEGRTAREIMTAPAITASPKMYVDEAARLLRRHRIRHLPVVDEHGVAVGMVSQGDLLKVFLRPDGEIIDAVRNQLIVETLWIDPSRMTVAVEGGVVRLAGELDRRTDVEIVERLTPLVDGVVAVESTLTYRYDDTKLRPQVGSPLSPPEW